MQGLQSLLRLGTLGLLVNALTMSSACGRLQLVPAPGTQGVAWWLEEWRLLIRDPAQESGEFSAAVQLAFWWHLKRSCGRCLPAALC